LYDGKCDQHVGMKFSKGKYCEHCFQQVVSRPISQLTPVSLILTRRQVSRNSDWLWAGMSGVRFSNPDWSWEFFT